MHPLVILLVFHLLEAAGLMVATGAVAMPFLLTLVTLALSIAFVLTSHQLGWVWLYRPPGVGKDLRSPPAAEPQKTGRAKA